MISELRLGNYIYIGINEIFLEKEGGLSALDKIRAQYNKIDNGKIFKVLSIFKSGEIEIIQINSLNSISFTTKCAFGIELNKIILEQLGWKETVVVDSMTNPHKQFVIGNDNSYCLRIEGNSKYMLFQFNRHTKQYTYLTEIHYVHQLQNLYYFLLGEELSLLSR